MKTEELTIQGMTCGHCVMHVRKALSKLQGLKVENVEVGKALVEFDETVMTREQIAGALENAGYKLAP
jgi:copper chaperone